MTHIRKGLLAGFAAAVVAASGAACLGAPVFYYDWETSPAPWTKVERVELNFECFAHPTWGNWNLFSDTSHSRSPTRAGRAERNYKACYYSYYDLPAAYEGGVYATVWVFEDGEHNKPNMGLELRESLGDNSEYLGIVSPDTGINPDAPGAYNNTGYTVVRHDLVTPSETIEIDPAYARRQGWRQYGIRINGATDTPGDVEYYIDNAKVHEDARFFNSVVNQLRLGSPLYSYEFYWYDDVTVDTWVSASSVTQAKQMMPGTSVELTGVTALAWGPATWGTKPSPEYTAFVADPRGRFWIQDANSDGIGLKVLTASEIEPGDNVRVMGMIADRNGERVLEAVTVDVLSSGNADPGEPVIVNGKTTLKTNGIVPASLAKTYGNITALGDGYVVIDDGSGLSTAEGQFGLKVYTPAALLHSLGDYISAVGVIDTEMKNGVDFPVLRSRTASDLQKLD